MRYILLALIFLISACSGINSKNERISATDNSPRFTDEGKFIHDDSFRIGSLQSCDSTQTFVRKTFHGSWYKLKDCTFRLHGMSINKSEISIHKDQNGTTNGLKFLVYPDTEYGQHLLARYQPYLIYNEPGICIQYYQSTFPILTIADESLCDALRYKNI